LTVGTLTGQWDALGADHEGIDDPAQIIETANRYAGAGCPVVLEPLASRDLRLTPLTKILDFAASLYETAHPAAETTQDISA